VTHVGADELGFHAERAQLSRQRLTGFVAATGDDDAGAFASEGKGRGTSDAGKGAGDRRGNSCEYSL
jgi:hypothetical protein